MSPDPKADDPRGVTRYRRLLDVVVRRTGSPQAFLGHETGALLAHVPQGPGGNELAHQASAIVETAASMARGLRLQGVNMALLDCREGRVLLFCAGPLIMGCVVPVDADLGATLGSLQDALGGL